MEREISAIEKIFDENNSDPIVLYDENNKETKFDQVAVIPLYEKVYVILKPLSKIAGVNDDEALVFVVEEIDDEDCLVICDDMKIVDEVFKEYYILLKEEWIIEYYCDIIFFYVSISWYKSCWIWFSRC